MLFSVLEWSSQIPKPYLSILIAVRRSRPNNWIQFPNTFWPKQWPAKNRSPSCHSDETPGHYITQHELICQPCAKNVTSTRGENTTALQRIKTTS